MATATITSKGQITIPKSVRMKLKLEAGHRVEFIETEAGVSRQTGDQGYSIAQGDFTQAAATREH